MHAQVHAFQIIQIVTEFACDLVCSRRLATQQVNLALALIGEAEAKGDAPPGNRTESARFHAVFGTSVDHGKTAARPRSVDMKPPTKATAVRGLDRCAKATHDGPHTRYPHYRTDALAACE